MKTCSKCKIEKPLEEFAINRSRRDGRQSFCKECKRVNDREYYRLNSKKHRKYVYEKRAIRKRENIGKVVEYFRTHPCVDCGETDPLVLEFDHRGDKIDNVSAMITEHRSWKKIKQEIDKCDVRCANCHRKKTAHEQNWLITEII